MGSDTMSMIEAIKVGIAECASRTANTPLTPTDLVLTPEAGQRLLRQMTGSEYTSTEIGKLFGLRIVTDSNLPERYALLRLWKEPTNPYANPMLWSMIVGVVDFGDA